MKTTVEYQLSAYLKEQWPADGLPEVVVLGRSNSGKSTLINALGRSKVAKVSQSPGKTQSLNFYLINSKYRWVDVPGYGFAERGGKEVRSWQKMIETYLRDRINLVGAILIVDSRRTWREDEEMLEAWMKKLDIPLIVAINKIDKLTKAEKTRVLKDFSKETVAELHPMSGVTGEGVDDLEKMVYLKWVQQQLNPTEIGP